MALLISDPLPDSPSAVQLRRKLDAFYNGQNANDYFGAACDQSGWYELFRSQLEELLQKPRAHVLELGAGTSVFGRFSKEMRPRLVYHAQDVTEKNKIYLEGMADHVHIGDISSVEGKFDLIFHTFVLEHVASPRPFLEQVDARLNPGGYHIVICPRYDLPGFVCPSMRHLSSLSKVLHSARMTASRLACRMGASPRFWVNTDPAMFHKPWYRDADAVHLVSRYDVEQWHKQRGYTSHVLNPRQPFLQRKITLAMAFKKTS